ncbi:hypothetical protein FH972_024627 [Carpinus fangiana]|uniref:Methyltransferase domain-containing protein n=1 Tax=Carpinus fangiana TaxID=176857 RepID=A0A5N6L133_9ROSI|nr:hypothetical protein FH972_024627 [Carpinus fangiana]
MAFILHDDLSSLAEHPPTSDPAGAASEPPQSLVEYVHGIRRLLLDRRFTPRAVGGEGTATGSGKQARDGAADAASGLTRQIAVGMKEKKVHEVFHFSRFLDELAGALEDGGRRNDTGDGGITHLVDFGAGQNYLGRALASAPINRNVVAVEGRPHNIEGAKRMDITAKLAARTAVLRNKKVFRKGLRGYEDGDLAVSTESLALNDSVESSNDVSANDSGTGDDQDSKHLTGRKRAGERIEATETRTVLETSTGRTVKATTTSISQGIGTVQHVEHRLEDGDLSRVVSQIVDPGLVQDEAPIANLEELQKENGTHGTQENGSLVAVKSIQKQKPNLMVIGLHSCGNLTHHGLKSLILNPEVSAVAIVGCCYNLTTERLTPPTYKLPGLRPESAALGPEAQCGDPEGFPMSERLCNYPLPNGEKGLHLNITTRMMAVQAPQNWGPTDSEDFFTRHFYRALLQRVFLDRGVVGRPSNEDGMIRGYHLGGRSAAGTSSAGATQPIIIGSLRKGCYENFVSYVRGAVAKLVKDPVRGAAFNEKVDVMTDDEIARYETEFLPKKKELSIVWTLMAYSAGLVEAIIVVDRWQWLREQPEVRESWVEPVFDFARSPRNLVVVGLK